jgi:hypothetical protein
MSDINKTNDIDIVLQSGRFKILSVNGEYKPFKGISSGQTTIITKYKNKSYTPGHQIMVNGEFKKIKDLKGAETTNVDDTTVYDILHVEDTHSYISNDNINKNCLILK